MKEPPLSKAFMLIEPGPVTLVTTAAGRRKNVMTISWAMVMDFSPKLLTTALLQPIPQPYRLDARR